MTRTAHATSRPPPREHWSSGLAFVLAAAGSAIGLGNIWKFPYITGMNGGGWFVLIYLVAVLCVALPIMVAEILIGRTAQRSPVAAFRVLDGPRRACRRRSSSFPITAWWPAGHCTTAGSR